MRTGGPSRKAGGALGGVGDEHGRGSFGGAVVSKGAGSAGNRVAGGGGSFASKVGSSGGKSRLVGDGRQRDQGFLAEVIEGIVDLMTQHGGEQ